MHSGIRGTRTGADRLSVKRAVGSAALVSSPATQWSGHFRIRPMGLKGQAQGTESQQRIEAMASSEVTTAADEARKPAGSSCQGGTVCGALSAAMTTRMG
jgi:hypothetical protein